MGRNMQIGVVLHIDFSPVNNYASIRLTDIDTLFALRFMSKFLAQGRDAGSFLNRLSMTSMGMQKKSLTLNDYVAS